ncbi:hypothetical protein CG775_24105 [Paenibacillus polymyxa]|nr:hypothetical protein CG775_24105 [Paenibacillus polymyxa]
MSFEPFIRLRMASFFDAAFSLHSACDFVVNMKSLYYKMILKVGRGYMRTPTTSIEWYDHQIREDGCYCMRSVQKAPGYIPTGMPHGRLLPTFSKKRVSTCGGCT